MSTDSVFKLHPPVANTYQAIVTDTLNCKDTSTVAVSLDAMPTAPNAGGNDTICVDAGTYPITATPATVGTGQWNLLNGTASINNNLNASTSINAFGVDTISLEWQTTNGVCPVKRDTIEVIIHPTPVAGVLS